jgi:hypothetical protein
VNLIIGSGFDDGHFTQVHDTIVCNKRNADFHGVVGNGHLGVVKRLKHVFHFGDDEVEGVGEDAVALLLKPAGDDTFRKIAGFVNRGLKIGREMGLINLRHFNLLN